MTPTLENLLKGILAIELPAGTSISDVGLRLAKEVNIGRSAFLLQTGEKSEYDYKRTCIQEKKIMYHAHIGMGSWGSTAEALLRLHEASIASGFQVDRVGICLDRRMALPKDMRQGIPAETGPMLESSQDWHEVGNIVPIQPHMGDFMIGFPASVENTVNALEAGVTTVGNLSQFFAHEAPMWRDHVKTTAETVCAIALMGGLRDKGALVHSYLEDGYGARLDSVLVDHAGRSDGQVLPDEVVDDMVHLFDFLGHEGVQVRKVKAQPFRRYQRTALLGVLAHDLA